MTDSPRHRVVIVGGGGGGIEAAKALRLPGTFEIVRVPPGEPLPPCCQTLMAGWSIELRANAESRLESISAVLRSGSVEFGQASLDPPWQGPIRLVPGGSLILAQRLLATMPASLPDSFYLRVHLDVSMENGYRRKIDVDMPLTRSGS